MRKLFYAGIALLCVTLLASCGKSGTSDPNALVGKWQMKKEQKEYKADMKVTYDLELKADKTLSAYIDAMMAGSEKGFTMQLPFSIAFEGTWNTTDGKLEIKADEKTTKLKMDKDKVVFETDNPAAEKMISVLKETLISNMESQAKEGVGKKLVPQEAMAYKLEGNKLMLISTKDTLVFEKK